MPAIHMEMGGDPAEIGRRLGVNSKPVIHTAADWTVAALERGMVSGATSLMVMIPCVVNGTSALVLAETSLQCWMMAAGALRGKFAAEVDQPGFAVLSPAAKRLLTPRLVEAIRRGVPVATVAQAADAAEMVLSAFAADAPGTAK